MHKAKSPPFAEKRRAFFEGTIVSMSSLFYETVKKYYLFYVIIVGMNKICSGI